MMIGFIINSSIALFFQMKGTFKINLPHVLIGYETEAEKSRKKSPKFSHIQSHQTHLEMEFFIQPSLPRLCPNMVCKNFSTSKTNIKYMLYI